MRADPHIRIQSVRRALFEMELLRLRRNRQTRKRRARQSVQETEKQRAARFSLHFCA